MSNYVGGFKDGVSIRGIPVNISHPGKVFWVSNASTAMLSNQRAGSDGNDGSFNAPFATLDYAVGQCVASRGDIIFIKPGHTETVSSATALALDVAGVAIIGLGTGSLRPTFTLNTATTATIGVSAANVALKNIRISANFADIVAAVTTANAPYFTMEDVEIRATATDMNFLSVVDTNATDNNTDGLALIRCTWLEPDAATLAMVKMDGTNKEVLLQDNYVVSGGPGTSGGALMRIATGKVVTQAKIVGNRLECATGDAGANGVLITTDGATNSGMIDGNRISHTDTTGEVLVTASSGFSFGLNYASGVKTASGYVLPAADS